MSSVKGKKAGKTTDAPEVIEEMLPLVPCGKLITVKFRSFSVNFSAGKKVKGAKKVAKKSASKVSVSM